ncbi:hypothetical protein QW060_05500 [Myroides ceti]|uniref:Uncharacterized protein n=1 Tax=Paenimyroides ceti TaxID=395087 RepID=A0ABT8CSG3_9FLAO|nr:hypothetical protein [Paenimyroides ceti]MDN3706583.1 hypothetical protein [Paenimyroides ceti]
MAKMLSNENVLTSTETDICTIHKVKIYKYEKVFNCSSCFDVQQRI